MPDIDILAVRPVAGAPMETAWGQQVHDALQSFQMGTAALTVASGAGSVLVTFPRPFLSAPIILVGLIGAPSYKATCLIGAPSLSGFTFNVWTTGLPGGEGGYTGYWLAFGSNAG